MPFVRSLALLSLILVSAVPAGAVDESDFCPSGADPCEFNGAELNIDADTQLDFGTRTVVIGQSKRINITGGRTLTIQAGTFIMRVGSRIGNAATALGANLTVTAIDDIIMKDDGLESRSRVELPGSVSGGNILFTAGGDIDIDGELRSNGTAADAAGGLIDLEAGGGVTVAGIVNLRGGTLGSGGEFIIGADGPIVMSSPVDASGGFEGGVVDFSSNASLATTAILDVRGTTGGGLGGTVSMDVVGSITIGGKIAALGAGSAAGGGGFGSDFVELSAGTSLFINETIDLSGGGPEGFGGSATLAAEVDVIQKRSVTAIGAGTGGIGGDITYSAGRLLSLEAPTDVSGSDQGGDMSASGRIEIQVMSNIFAEGAGVNGSGGTIGLDGTALGIEQVSGSVVVNGTLRTFGDTGGGDISIIGCNVTIPGTATLNNGGSQASNDVKASGLMTIAGRFMAGPTGVNVLNFRDLDKQPVLTGATFDPMETVTHDGTLPGCEDPMPPVCGDGDPTGVEGCDDGNLESCDGCSGTNGMGEDCHATGCCQEEACGNGMQECDELCDDGNVVDGDGCDSNCTPTGCGNGRVTTGEECDDDNQAAGDGCSETCVIEPPPGCGDGDLSDGEECDDDNNVNCDGCSKVCVIETCGNGVKECAETCDDGGTLACDGECDATCSRATDVCGDSVTECGEECDAGAANGTPGSACSGFCRTCAIGSGADCPCGTDFDCAPAGRCAGLACLSGACASVDVPACNDNNACNGAEACVDGECTVPTPPVCVDDDPCTDDTCTPAAGCPHARKTGFPGVTCRLDFIMARADGAAIEELPTKLRAKILKFGKGAADRITSAGQETRVKRQQKLLKAAEKQLTKLLNVLAKGLRKGQIAEALGSRLTEEAEGARSASRTLRAGLTG